MRNTLAALALAPLLLAGCRGESGATDDPTPKMPSTSSTTTSEPTSTEPTEPIMPSEAEGTDAKSAEAFVRYYFDVVNYAQATGNTARLKTLNEPACDTCKLGYEWIDKVYSQGGQMTGGEFTVKGTQSGLLSKKLAKVIATTAVSAQDISGTGTKDDKHTEPGRFEWQFRLALVDGEWSIVDWTVL